METKQCRTCKEVKGLDGFYKRGDYGFSGECKSCKAKRARKHYVENTARHALLVKRRYDTYGRFRRYGLSRDDYDAALIAQGNCCALCKATKPGGKGKWHIDHAHVGPKLTTFKQSEAHQFRGLLCHTCNIALGHFEQLSERVGIPAILNYLRSGLNEPPPASLAQTTPVSSLC